MIQRQMFTSQDAPPGQVVLLTGTTSWTVPTGVTSICVLAVQGGGDRSTPNPSPVTVTVSSTIVCRAENGNRIGDGGGDGGFPGTGYNDNVDQYTFPGGGGAGGYTNSGGNGAGYASGATAGSGGGGGGGTARNTGPAGLPGGGIGLLGQGTNGAAGGGNGSWTSGTAYGYGGGGNAVHFTVSGGRGGAAAYKNNIAVTPGQVVSVSIPATLSEGGPGAVRIIWGIGRSYPSTNTGDL